MAVDNRQDHADDRHFSCGELPRENLLRFVWEEDGGCSLDRHAYEDPCLQLRASIHDKNKSTAARNAVTAEIFVPRKPQNPVSQQSSVQYQCVHKC